MGVYTVDVIQGVLFQESDRITAGCAVKPEIPSILKCIGMGRLLQSRFQTEVATPQPRSLAQARIEMGHMGYSEPQIDRLFEYIYSVNSNIFEQAYEAILSQTPTEVDLIPNIIEHKSEACFLGLDAEIIDEKTGDRNNELTASVMERFEALMRQHTVNRIHCLADPANKPSKQLRQLRQ